MSKHYFSREDKRFALYFVGAALLAIVFLAPTIIRPFNKVSNIRKIEGTVTDKTVKRAGKNDKYLVFIENESGEEVSLEVTDSLFRWRFDSSDVYAEIEKGTKYSFEVGGSRVPFLSWYPNIYSYEEIN